MKKNSIMRKMLSESPFKQKLSPAARAAKAERDLEYANSPSRKAKRAENQRLRRAAEKTGKKIDGMDYDHKDRKFKSVRENRGNDGYGTKKEGRGDY